MQTLLAPRWSRSLVDAFTRRALCMAVAALCVTAGTAEGQRRIAVPSDADSVVVTPGPRYGAGWLRRIFLGDNYRDLWTTPITVKVLDLREFAGGLKPTERGGGKQTKSLRFKGADGKEYAFRSQDKDPSPALPPEMRETIAEQLAQDYTTAIHPGGALVVAPLVKTAGVLQAEPQLVIMPDDEILGEFREDFAGMVGWIEERANEADDGDEGFAGASKVVGTEALFDRLEKSASERVDTRAYLAARLVDIFLGDWDRHREQWRWAKFGDDKSSRWVPIPKDRDYAFARFEGLLIKLVKSPFPQFTDFEPKYSNMYNLTWQAREIDRKLLTDLERPVWDSIARALQSRLTDAAIDAAVRELPPEYYARNGAELSAALRQRRDDLPRAASEFYELLAGEVDVYATDDSETVEIQGMDDLGVEVAIHPAVYAAGDATGEPYYRRRFRADETREVRIFLRGGDDRVILRGNAGDRPGIRVIGGGGDDEVTDSSSIHLLGFYDSKGDNRLVSRRGGKVHTREYDAPKSDRGPYDVPQDWGSSQGLVPWVSYQPDVGLIAGGGIVWTGYGFRSHPNKRRILLRAGYAAEAQAFRVDLKGDLRRVNSPVRTALLARYSGFDIIRFHGFGNETQAPEPSSFYKVEQEHFSLEPSLVIGLSPRATFSFGPVAKHASTALETGKFIAIARPYGIGSFGQVGGRAGLDFDTRDIPAAAARGVFLSASGAFYPEVWDVERTFGEAHGEAATYWSPFGDMRPTLALRAAGKKVWGTFPFHEAAYVGGRETVRGWRENRFAGDASLYGNAELRLFLTKFTLVLPFDFGVFGLADAGRVYLDGQSSDEWHTASGGGIWVSVFKRTNTFSAAIAKSEERTGVYVKGGFMF